jgi:cytochrome P450
LKSAWYLNLSNGGVYNVFNTIDPEYHSRHRRLLSSPLSDTSLRRLEPIITARVSLAIDKITEEMKIRGAADVFKWWSFMSTDIIGELSFGDSFRMLEQGKVGIIVEG